MTTDRCRDVAGLAAGFVLGALTSDEERLVREHLAMCPEPHAEFAELGGLVGYLDEAVDLVEPPASLKERIMAAAAAESTPSAGARTEGPREDVAPPLAPPLALTPFPADRARGAWARPRTVSVSWAAGLAAVLTVVALAGWNVALQRDLGEARDYQRGVSAVLDLAAQPGSQSAILSAEGGGGPTGVAAVGVDGRVAMVMRGLAPTAGSEVYEAWVIGSAGTPVDSVTSRHQRTRSCSSARQVGPS